MNYDLAIIGGGAAGMALHCLKQGKHGFLSPF